MSEFSLDWLRRRAPFDRAARDPGLARRFVAALPSVAGRPVRLVDLGAGSGANFRALAPLIPGDQEWILIDEDPRLLAAQRGETLAWAASQGYHAEATAAGVVIDTAGGRWILRGHRLDLARALDRLDDLGGDGMMTAAFIDLVSAPWLDAFAAGLARSGKPLLAVLGVDGRRLWHPPHAEDAIIAEAFAQHQASDKGFGPALGAAAPFHLADRLAAQGFTVDLATSDWRISPDHRGMLAELIAGEEAAASAARPEKSAIIAAWAARRRQEAAAGILSLTVGHRDVLAVPPAI